MSDRRQSGVVDFELKCSGSLLDPDLVCRVAGAKADYLTGVEIELDVNDGASVTLRMNAGRGLDLALPAAVSVFIEPFDHRTELVEEPLADGGRRFYVRHREQP